MEVFAIAAVTILLVIFVGIAAFWVSCYKKVDQGHALIINKMQAEPTVTFTGGVVIPVLHRSEVMNISVKTVEIDRRGKEGLICRTTSAPTSGSRSSSKSTRRRKTCSRWPRASAVRVPATP